MQGMDIDAVYCQPNTGKKMPGHGIYPYLLFGITVDRARQVWTLDETYIPIGKGFAYLIAVADWVNRKVLAASGVLRVTVNRYKGSLTNSRDFTLILDSTVQTIGEHFSPACGPRQRRKRR
ncbi:hypothetical protein MKFW12EY_34010 [Methylomonas koyamae]|nr:hypothetical protein MKFW12EY_34010 [Methylomonas koyamae]